MSTLKWLIGQGLVSKDDIVAICYSTQWMGTVAIDQDGMPLMNAIIRMDFCEPI